MNTFLDRMTFNVPDSGGGAAAASGASSSGSDAAAGSDASSSGSDAAAASSASSAGSDAAAVSGFYRPASLAPHMIGKDQNETMDNMAKALDGYRARDAQNGVPETAEAYGAFSADVPEPIRPHLDTLKDDALFARIGAKALERKMSVADFQALTTEFLSVSAEMGLMEPIVDEKAERAALVPDTAKHLAPAEQNQAVEKRMNDNYAFLDAAVAKGQAGGGLAKDDAEFAKAMLGDSAKGHRFLEWMQAQIGGSGGTGPSFGGTPSGGQDPKEALLDRRALPQNTPGHREYDPASYEALQADYKKVYGN